MRADRSLLPQAIEEGLRVEPPLLTINRTTTCEVELAGVTLGPGESITPHIGSANHDEARWDDPESFDIFRPAVPHIAFAHGPHMCLGMHLARLETRALLNRVFDRLPDLTLAARRSGPAHPRRRLPLPHVAAGHVHPGGLSPARAARAQAIWRISTSSPRAMRTLDTMAGGNRPWATTPGAASSIAASTAGSPTSPW